jgi:hypothetical protein
MEKNPLHIGLAALRALIILLGAGLLMAVSGASMPDESFLEGLANYGGALDAVFYIVYGAGIACTAAAIGFGVYFFAANFKDRKAQLIGLVVFWRWPWSRSMVWLMTVCWRPMRLQVMLCRTV